jgi:hypothetical protein
LRAAGLNRQGRVDLCDFRGDFIIYHCQPGGLADPDGTPRKPNAELGVRPALPSGGSWFDNSSPPGG